MTTEFQTPTPREIDAYIQKAQQMRARAVAQSFKALIALPGLALAAVAQAFRIPETEQL